MNNAMERFICRLHEIFDGLSGKPGTGVNEVGIMQVAQSCDTGTVVTFEVWLGPKHNSASIIFDARVVAAGIRITPKNIEQITSMSVLPLHQWVNLFNSVQYPMLGDSCLRAFTITWKLYNTIISDPEAWLRDVLERRHDEYEEECRNG